MLQRKTLHVDIVEAINTLIPPEAHNIIFQFSHLNQ